MTYEEIAKIILKEDFEPIAALYRHVCYNRWLSPDQEEELLEIFGKDKANKLEIEIGDGRGALYFLIYYGIEKGWIYSIDLSAEDNDGEIENSILHIIEKYEDLGFEWDEEEFNKKVDWDLLEEPGDYTSLVFRTFNKKLEELNFRMFFIDTGNDRYNYTVLPTMDVRQLLRSEPPLDMYDLTKYTIEITEIPDPSLEIMVLYLESRLGITRFDSRADAYLSRGTGGIPIVLATGALRLRVNKLAAEVKELGCKCIIRED